MKNSYAIAKKELNIYFATPIAYVMFTLFVVIGSYFFLRLLGAYEQASMAYMRFQQPDMMNRLNFQDAIFRNLFGNLGVILIFIIPFLTMRLIAEEKRQKTIELLYTTPITPFEIVFGKYLACLAILVLALALTLTYPLLVQFNAGDANGVEWRSVLLGYGGLFGLVVLFSAVFNWLFVTGSIASAGVIVRLVLGAGGLVLWLVTNRGEHPLGRGAFFGTVSAVSGLVLVGILVAANYIAVKK